MNHSLQHNDADLERLLDKLERDTPALTPRDVEILTGAFRALVADQLALLRLQRLLTIHGESAARLDAMLADARGAIAPLGDAEGVAFDAEAHVAARSALAKRVIDARTGRDIVLAALAFARDVAPAIAASSVRASFGR